MPNIQRTAELVEEISASSKEQDAGAEQINASIQQLDGIIQLNASASEEMAATAEELSSQSEQLAEMVAFFIMEEDQQQRRLGSHTRSVAKPAQKHAEQPRLEHASVQQQGFSERAANRDDVDNEYEAF